MLVNDSLTIRIAGNLIFSTLKAPAYMDSDNQAGLLDYFKQEGHFHNYPSRNLAFLDQLNFELSRLDTSATVLDVGCGRGIARKQEPQFEIAKRIGVYWGVEPDPSVQAASCFHHVWPTLLENADIPDSSVDLAYSQMVLEHVADPLAFLSSMSRILKPGGVFLSMTVNAKSTFGRISWTCHKLGIQDLVLRIALGKKLVDEYHYPAAYKMCTAQSLKSLTDKLDLSRLEITLLEADEWLLYFPAGTKWAGKLMSNILQRKIANYSWMMVRITQ